MMGAGGGAIVQEAPQALLLPAGARIEQVVVDGERLVLLGTDGAGVQFLAVVDPATGERLSLLRVRPEWGGGRHGGGPRRSPRSHDRAHRGSRRGRGAGCWRAP